MLTIDPKDVSVPKMHGYLLGAIVPRPIAFASTVDKSGNVNLSPFSYFNAFGANPPTLIFSPARRARDNTTKHTLQNVSEYPEVVINIVDYGMVEQMSLASTEYEKGINEFEKSGLTMIKSTMVKPPRVLESPAAFECKVTKVIPLGKEGGAGNLVICEILLAHFQHRILDADERIDPYKLDPVARLGGNWYARIIPDSIFEIPKPLATKGIGIDNMPESVRDSNVLTGNDLGRLGNVESLPDEKDVQEYAASETMKAFKEKFSDNLEEQHIEFHKRAQNLLAEGKTEEAWLTLLQI